MSFKMPNTSDNNHELFDALHKSCINRDDNYSCQESVDGQVFGYPKKPFDAGKLSGNFKRTYKSKFKK